MQRVSGSEPQVSTLVNGATVCTTTPSNAITASASGVWSMAPGLNGEIFFALRNNNVVCKLRTDGTVIRVAGNGNSGASTDGALATNSPLGGPISIASDSSGNLYIAEYDATFSIKKVDTSGYITTLLNASHTKAFGAAGSAAINTTSYGPLALAVSADGEVYYSEYSNSQVRKIDTSGNVVVVAGTGASGNTGNGGLATAARVQSISDIDFDSAGNIYLTSYSNNIRKIDGNGIITAFAGTSGVNTHTGDNGPASSATLKMLWQIALDSQDNIYIAERGGSTIRKINSSGTISTIVGLDGASGNVDGGAITTARISGPFGIAVSSTGDLYIGDYGNSAIKKVPGVALAAASPISIAFSGANVFRNSYSITVSGGTSGKITYFANGKRISGCVKRAYMTTYTCVWKPSFRGLVSIKVEIKPVSGSTLVSDAVNVAIQNRSTNR